MFKVARFLLFFSAIATLSANGLGTPQSSTNGLSNGARLARGLPLRSPKFGRFHPGSATPVVDARAPSVSTIPVSGNIKVTRANDDAMVGFVSAAFIHVVNRNGITNDQSLALTVSFAAGVNPIELTETPPTDSNHPFLGAVVGPGSDNNDLLAGSSNYLLVTGTSHTPAGAPPSLIGNSYSAQASESTIWHYNIVTHELTATWINSDGAAAPTFLYYDPDTTDILFVGDPVAFGNSRAPRGYVVKWTVV